MSDLQKKTEAPKPDLDTTAGRAEDLRRRRDKLHLGGGADALAKRAEKGLLSARQRVLMLSDPESFQEMYLHRHHRCNNFDMAGKELAADGVVTGLGVVDGRPVYMASQDFTVAGGSLGAEHGAKIVDMMKLALKSGHPFVMINDSGGARIQEGVDSLNAYGEIFYHNTISSGVIPQLSLICGPCAGGAVYSPALTDFIIMVRGNKMFITGPEVVRMVTGEEISAEDLGGADAHASVSGNIHFVADDDEHAFEIVRRLLGYLPANNMEDPPFHGHAEGIDLSECPSLDALVPDDPRAAYDVRDVIHTIVDGGEFLEVQEHWALNIVVGFARVDGFVVGIVANQPNHMAGCLDIDASDKGAAFIRFCNAFNIPLVTLVDVPGYLPGVAQEHGGIIRHGAKMLYAYSETTTPKVTVILRKAYGGAYLAMSPKSTGADRTCAWPSSEIAVMGADGAVPIIFRREMAAAEDKEAKRRELVRDYREKFSNPYQAASRGLIDDVILPRETRRYIATALHTMRNKRVQMPPKKHGLMPA